MSTTVNEISEIRHNDDLYEFRDNVARRQILNLAYVLNSTTSIAGVLNPLGTMAYQNDTLTTDDDIEYVRCNGEWKPISNESSATNELNNVPEVWPVSRGGTGVTSYTELANKLNISSSNSSQNVSDLASASGILSIEKGGTGTSTLLGIKETLGLSSMAYVPDVTGDLIYARSSAGWTPITVNNDNQASTNTVTWNQITGSITTNNEAWSYLQHLNTPSKLSSNTTLGALAWEDDTPNETDNFIRNNGSWTTLTWDKIGGTFSADSAIGTAITNINSNINSITTDIAALQTTVAGKAASSHNHSAANITSGVMALARGGTGQSLSAAPSLLVNLSSTTPTSIFAASPRPGITGKLPIAYGGTGLAAAPSMLVNLSTTTAASPLVASPRPGITGKLPIAYGGTNATTAAAALTNLGISLTTTDIGTGATLATGSIVFVYTA